MTIGYTHDYIRHGTTTLFARLRSGDRQGRSANVGKGHQEFLAFLRTELGGRRSNSTSISSSGQRCDSRRTKRGLRSATISAFTPSLIASYRRGGEARDRPHQPTGDIRAAARTASFNPRQDDGDAVRSPSSGYDALLFSTIEGNRDDAESIFRGERQWYDEAVYCATVRFASSTSSRRAPMCCTSPGILKLKPPVGGHVGNARLATGRTPDVPRQRGAGRDD